MKLGVHLFLFTHTKKLLPFSINIMFLCCNFERKLEKITNHLKWLRMQICASARFFVDFFAFLSYINFLKTRYLTEHNVVLIWLRLALIILHLWFIRSLFSVWVKNENIMILKSTVSYFVQVMLNIFPCHQPTLWR